MKELMKNIPEDKSAISSFKLRSLKEVVPPAGIEPALPKELDFESSASTNSTRGASLPNTA